MAGITISEELHVVNGLPPVDIAGVAKASDYFALTKYTHASILVSVGAIGNPTTLTVEAAQDSSGTGSTAIPFEYCAVTAANGDTLGARTAATASGFSISATDDNKHYIIEIDARQLPEGSPWLVVKLSAAAQGLVCVLPILSGARYQGAVTPSAI